MLGDKCEIDNPQEFIFFKRTYEHQLKTQTNCKLAFQLSQERFLIKYGYKPYGDLDDYLSELFHHLNGFRLFGSHL